MCGPAVEAVEGAKSTMTRRILMILTAGALLTGGAVAAKGPQIAVDKADVDLGTIEEGAREFLEHTYIIKNTGDEKLVIKQVRPG